MAVIARNLLAGGRRHRLLMGIAFTAIAVIGGAALVAAGLPRGTRVLPRDPLLTSARWGFLQYRDHT